MRLPPCVCAVGLVLAMASSALAQDTAKPAETKVVLRVSRELIQKLAGARFVKDQPIASNANGASVSGTAHVEGDIDVRLRESDTESDFDLILTGNIATQLTAVRRPVVVCAHGNAPFSAARRVVFQGGKFTAQPVSIDVCNQFTLDGIDSLRGGIGGAVTRRVARPFVRRGLGDANFQANDEIRSDFASGIEEPTNRVVSALNTLEPTVELIMNKIVATAEKNKLDIVTYHKGTKHYLLFSVGHRNEAIAKLPSLPRDQRAPLELWIKKREKLTEEIVLEAFLLLAKEKWRKDAKKIAEQIMHKHPELSQVFGDEINIEAHIRAQDDWHVVTLTPMIKGRAIIELP